MKNKSKTGGILAICIVLQIIIFILCGILNEPPVFLWVIIFLLIPTNLVLLFIYIVQKIKIIMKKTTHKINLSPEEKLEKEKIIQFITEDQEQARTVELSEKYKKDKDIAMALAKVNGTLIRKVDTSIINKEIMLEALKSNFSSEKYIPEELYDDKDIALFVVSRNGHLLWKVSDRLNDDLEVVVEAIKNDPSAIRFASKRLKNSPEVKESLEYAKKKQRELDEAWQQELKMKVTEFKNKPIWWTEEATTNYEKLAEPVTSALIEYVEANLGHKLPNRYLELLQTQNGGRLIKRYYYLPQKNNSRVFEIDSICGISDKSAYGIIEKNINASDWFSYIDFKDVIVFGDDISAGHAHYMFDYTALNANHEPKIVYYDNELNEKIILADSFEEFIDNLKIHEEIDLIFLAKENNMTNDETII